MLAAERVEDDHAAGIPEHLRTEIHIALSIAGVLGLLYVTMLRISVWGMFAIHVGDVPGEPIRSANYREDGDSDDPDEDGDEEPEPQPRNRARSRS
ncbi:hypothetical protein [Dactylosporangium sp. CA-092794]|uniref:hypothetical protein n=1 Tax=Dactylosporangium sp. CA-092794 TaxID=3239929 RepID=UPI003D947BE8